jgi:hypothetical protein
MSNYTGPCYVCGAETPCPCGANMDPGEVEQADKGAERMRRLIDRTGGKMTMDDASTAVGIAEEYGLCDETIIAVFDLFDQFKKVAPGGFERNLRRIGQDMKRGIRR